ncbi:MAG: rhodanese-like domain-containing protein [Chitinophagaceae bacterium]
MKTATTFVLCILLALGGIAQQKTVLPVNDFEKAVQAGGAQLLDVRTPEEFKSGYIKGALNADWQNEKQFAQQVKKLDKAAPVYLYCLSGIRSGKAADWLAANGFKEIVNLEGGIQAWKAADKKLTIK